MIYGFHRLSVLFLQGGKFSISLVFGYRYVTAGKKEESGKIQKSKDEATSELV